MLIKKDIINLRDAALNQAVRLQDKTTVIVRRYARSTKKKNNCASCVFRERGIDASRCEYTLACFAHNRPDREPVYFEEVKRNT